jgi:hypothetical protein
MKVKLLEGILFPAHLHEAPWCIIDHHSVAVVDDMQRGRLVIELDWRQVRLLGIVDVDEGLLVPTLTWSKLRFELTPTAWPTHLAVVPRVFGMMLLGRTQAGYSKPAADDSKENGISNLHKKLQ